MTDTEKKILHKFDNIVNDTVAHPKFDFRKFCITIKLYFNIMHRDQSLLNSN